MRRLQKVRSFKELDGNKNGERTSAYFEKTSISPPSQNSHLLKSRQSLALQNLQQSHSTFPVIFFAQDSRKIRLISSVERSSASSFPSRTLQIALFYYHNRNQKYVSWTWLWTIFIGCVFHHRNHNRSDVVDSSHREKGLQAVYHGRGFRNADTIILQLHDWIFQKEHDHRTLGFFWIAFHDCFVGVSDGNGLLGAVTFRASSGSSQHQNLIS